MTGGFLEQEVDGNTQARGPLSCQGACFSAEARRKLSHPCSAGPPRGPGEWWRLPVRKRKPQHCRPHGPSWEPGPVVGQGWPRDRVVSCCGLADKNSPRGPALQPSYLSGSVVGSPGDRNQRPQSDSTSDFAHWWVFSAKCMPVQHAALVYL